MKRLMLFMVFAGYAGGVMSVGADQEEKTEAIADCARLLPPGHPYRAHLIGASEESAERDVSDNGTNETAAIAEAVKPAVECMARLQHSEVKAR